MNPSLDSYPLFSIIIPTYNQSKFLPYALDSIISQSCENWEAIIINDGSTDSTAAVAESYCRRDDRFKVFHKKNGGVASALNEGLKRACGNWICWLSSDDLFEPDKLDIHIEAILKYPKIFFFYTHFYYLDDKTGIKSTPKLWNAIPERGQQVSRFFFGPYIHGNSIAIHRNVFETIGLFDDTYPNGQDFEMWLRISSKFESKYINKRTCTTRWHESQTTHEFPEAGFFDSTRASIEFINSHDFPQIFPLLDLKEPDQAVAAIIEAIEVTTKKNSLIHNFGPTTAIIDRLLEWLFNINEIELKQTLIKILRKIFQTNRNINLLYANIPNPLDESINKISFSYKEYETLKEAKKYSYELVRTGKLKESESLIRYINIIENKLKFMGRSNVDFWKIIQENKYFEKHHCYGKAHSGLKVFGDDVKKIQEYKQLSNKMKVVVIGCGYGRESVLIAPYVEHVYGIDVSNAILNKAKKFADSHGINNFTPILADKWKTMIPHNIDIVYCMVVFQHLTRDLVNDYIRGLAEKLSPEGIFICQFADLIYGTRDSELKPYEPSVRWNKRDIIDLVNTSGLNIYDINTTKIKGEGYWHWACFGKKNHDHMLAELPTGKHQIEKKITQHTKILMYYSGLHNSSSPYAGTSNAIIKIAKYLKQNYQLDITLIGNYINIIENLDGLLLSPPPESNKIQEFSDHFDIIIFATHLDLFENVTKHTKQTWILHQHCWNVDNKELNKINMFDSIISLSSIHKSHLISQGVDTDIIYTVSNLLDTEHFYPRNVQRDNYSIMFSGAIVEHKNVHILIEAFKILYKNNKKLSLHIYGSASMWFVSNEYENYLHSQKNDNVYFYGRVSNEEMPYHYSRHSIYCMPSKLESFGLGTIEAQSCGCIPVVHNTGGVSATINNLLTGFIYKINTPRALATELDIALNKVLQNESIRAKAVRFVHENFNETTICKKYFNALSMTYNNTNL